MIGYLEGNIKHTQTGKIILFANGIGFTVRIPSNLNYPIGEQASLFIHTHLRDDNLSLFGFKTAEDLNLFELLISVSGVGPKIGLGIFSQSTVENITNAIRLSNLNFFTSISGVGKKTAQRLILDLKSKIDKSEVNMQNMMGDSELVSSLISLGFQKTEINQVISDIDSSEDLGSQVKKALKLLKK